MYRRPRIIPCLSIKNGGLVKTQKFSNPRYLGDPINAVKIFNNKGVDELCILDISATNEQRKPSFDLLHDIATEAFMPLSYGGGIRDIADIKKLFSIGFEKVVLNTALVTDQKLIRDAVAYAGSQSIVASIDVKSSLFGKRECYIEDGKKKSGMDPLALALKAKELGVGEILLNSINQDGMMSGFDIDLIRTVADSVDIPVIACGGCGELGHIKQALEEGHADAVAAGSFFVYYGKNKAILITAPTETDYVKCGIYELDD